MGGRKKRWMDWVKKRMKERKARLMKRRMDGNG